jgi:hypothetical protein
VARHIKVGTQRETLLPLVAAVVLILVGLWLRWPTLTYEDLSTQDAYNQFAFDRFAYSDIASLYFRDGLAGHPRPYVDYPLEYPVGLGLLIYLLSLATSTMPQYFLLTFLAMAVSAIWIAVLVPRFPRGNLLLFALSPALALYVDLNWDMWGVLLMVVALLLFVRERDGPATVVLTAAIWTKFFPILFLPFLVLDRMRRDGRRDARRIVTIFALGSVAINAPVLLLAPGGWWHFFAFNAARDRDWNLWMFFDPSWLSTAEINRLSALLLVWGLVVLLMLQRRLPAGAWLPACCAMLAWFFFVNKSYSPQYGLWIVALLAVIGASSALAVAWSAADLLYFVAGFIWFGLSQYGDAQEWFADYGFLPATALREGMLLIVIGWCLKQMRTPTRDPTQDHGERSRGSPADVT